ncbi:hypothetical protein D3C84_975140 [compost metagenome]
MCRFEDVAAVEDHLVAQALADQTEVCNAEVQPFSENHQSVGIIQGRLLGVGQMQVVALAIKTSSLLHGFRVEGVDPRTGRPEGLQ